MSRLEILNKFLIQFFFIRICKTTDISKRPFGILYFIIPFTGWSNNYKTIGRLKVKLFNR